MEILLTHYTGLGDYFICNGLVNFTSQFVDKIFLPIPDVIQPTLQCLYSENPKIELFVIPPEEYSKCDGSTMIEFANKHNLDILKVHWGKPYLWPSFEKDMYESINLDYNIRYNYFHAPKSPKEEKVFDYLIKQKPYCLVNYECGAGKIPYNVATSLPIVFVERGITDNFLDFMKVIREADEIHCLDSSMYHLVENINVKAKLYFHHVRYRPDELYKRITPSKKWIVLES
jgi:hypothetical protein